jgi:hypothetical protein
MKKLFTNRFARITGFVLLGGLGGFAYYYFIGCQGGSCPITGNPYISTSYGMMVGLLLTFDSKKKKEKDGQ